LAGALIEIIETNLYFALFCFPIFPDYLHPEEPASEFISVALASNYQSAHNYPSSR
jgi:hypothetical protein